MNKNSYATSNSVSEFPAMLINGTESDEAVTEVWFWQLSVISLKILIVRMIRYSGLSQSVHNSVHRNYTTVHRILMRSNIWYLFFKMLLKKVTFYRFIFIGNRTDEVHNKIDFDKTQATQSIQQTDNTIQGKLVYIFCIFCLKAKYEVVKCYKKKRCCKG